jgi:hypothetical protein
LASPRKGHKTLLTNSNIQKNFYKCNSLRLRSSASKTDIHFIQ